ncbi:DUF1517 domain-containing protein [Gloeocapsopsis crepidinum LEGE 06123]|uniref:DUF1517 domain-containing protein n=1 Tax=Gloeocapsopsis crepidinum LEGE 06123 TaxID=588587 RepID=A0ABR9UV76_9CHRO|nr:DUF1517 domain-containing protein [Gloeocapsopsis crepidinum]MBE9192196.1 DUF1517 domain-containing protein [Gloeocapsopsis crepidinum LEGE 06123]
MNAWRDRLNRMTNRTRFVVCRIFVHLAGSDVAPLLGILNRTAREAIDTEGDLEVLGEGLVEVCQSLLQYDEYWLSAANEGDVFWDEGEAGDYFNELFTDSAQRYLSEVDLDGADSDLNEPLSLPATRNVVVMVTAAFEGEVPELETNLADVTALKAGLKALINLHYQEKLRGIQVHFSPAQFGDELTNDQLLQYFPELVPL